MSYTPIVPAIDNAILDFRFQLLKRPASGEVVLVAIDPASLQAEERWPWPRDRYAHALRNLKNAGANVVAFDIDFSARAQGDEELIAALSQWPGESVLAVYSQRVVGSYDKQEFVETMPNPVFLQDAVLAGVNLIVEKDGLIRRGWFGTGEGVAYRASLATTLSQLPGMPLGTFLIDFGIDPHTVPVLPFHKVLSGDFNPELVAGKHIVIGATAYELGDEFSAPIHGMLPGPMFHIMSFESLYQQRGLVRIGKGVSLGVAALLIFFIFARGKHLTAKHACCFHLPLLALIFILPVLIQALVPVCIDVAIYIFAQALCYLYLTRREIRQLTSNLLHHRIGIARAQALANMVVTNSQLGVLVTDDTGRVELCNDRAAMLLRVQTGEMVGTVLRESVTAFPVHDPIALQKSGSDHLLADNWHPTQKDDLVLEVTLSISGDETHHPMHSVQLGRMFVYTLRDVTELRAIQEKQEQATQAAEAANRFKSQLISNMSHELRTPLNGIIGFSDMLVKESFGPHAVSEYKDFAENIHTSGARLLGLVNNMLMVASLDGGEYVIDPENMKVDELIEDAMYKIASHSNQSSKEISIDIADDVDKARIDPRAFTDLMAPLLDNALKFTHDDGAISIKAWREGEDLLLTVIDNGVGCERAILPMITQAFYQGDGDRTRAHEGAGLGLYVVKKLLDLHNGTISFSSTPNKGFAAKLCFADAITGQAAKQAAA